MSWLLRSSAITLTLLFALPPALAGNARCWQAFNDDGPKFRFGLEFTLTNQAIVDEGNANPGRYDFTGNPLKEAAWNKFVETIKRECSTTGECTTSWTNDKHGKALRADFKNGHYFTLGIDSAVLEVNAQPRTSAQFAEVMPLMKHYVFDLGRQVGLTPHARAGGGHIHIERAAFEEKTLMFRNFFVDFQNRPELAYGALGNHLGNSAPLAAFKPEQRDAVQSVLAQFDPSTQGIDTLVNQLHEKVFTQGIIEAWGSPTYYQAFNMTRMKNGPAKATLEVRSFRPQASEEHYLLQNLLLQRWLNRLRPLSRPIEYVRKDRHEYEPQEIVDAFAQLLKDLDLPYDEFRMLLPPALHSIKPSDQLASVPYKIDDYK